MSIASPICCSHGWVRCPDFGYDTGIAVANTGYDVGALTPPTVGDPGVIRVSYFYPQTFGAAPVAPTPVTTAVVVPGDTDANAVLRPSGAE